MFFNLYPLSNTGFINLGRAQFLCDLITGTPIDIYAHIFQTIGKTTARSAAKMCLPFCSLLMKIILHEGVSPPRDGKLLVRRRPISISSLEKSKSHSSAEWKKQNLFTPPKGEFVQHVTHSGYGSVTHTIETTSSHIPAPPTVSIQLGQSSSHADRFTILVEGLRERVLGLINVLYSINNQVQMRLTAIETQLDVIQRKLEESL